MWIRLETVQLNGLPFNEKRIATQFEVHIISGLIAASKSI